MAMAVGLAVRWVNYGWVPIAGGSSNVVHSVRVSGVARQ